MSAEDFALLPTNEIWVSHLACVSWMEEGPWTTYLASAEDILGASITHLDKNDSMKRCVKPGRFPEYAEYLTSMGKQEDSRWIFGRLASIGVDFAVRHYRECRGWPNSATWYFPPNYFQDPTNIEAVYRLFEQGNLSLSPFYAYADEKTIVSRKKRESGAVDIQAELLGVFWLSYFGPPYVSFFGKDTLAGIPEAKVVFNGGATLRLGGTPSSVPNGFRESIEAELGLKAFVEPSDMLRKRPGQYALTFAQMRVLPEQKGGEGQV